MNDLYSAFSLPLITTHPFPRKNAAVLTEGWFTQRSGGIRCGDKHWMYRHETGDYFNRSLLEDRGGWILSPCLSHISSYGDAQKWEAQKWKPKELVPVVSTCSSFQPPSCVTVQLWTGQCMALSPTHLTLVSYRAVRAEAGCPILEEIWYKNILAKKKPTFSAITPCCHLFLCANN